MVGIISSAQLLSKTEFVLSSSRSYQTFNLISTLEAFSDLLASSDGLLRVIESGELLPGQLNFEEFHFVAPSG
jgi:hypothetical protein